KAGALLIAAACVVWSAYAHAQTGDTVVAMDSQRDIVLAVANPVDPPPTHAGSSLLGYTPSCNYGAGQRAVSLLATLQRSYHWHQLVGWPIKSLDLYCIVLEPPDGTKRDALLAALVRDKRVQLAEPLRNFSVYSSDQQDARKYNDPYVDLQRGFVETAAARAQTATQGAGTEVAGIIGAIADNHIGIVGMAPKARLSIYKACWYSPDADAGARCNSFTLAKALAAVMDTN